MVCTVGLTVFMLPTVLNSESRVPRWTSFPTAVIVGMTAIPKASLELWWAMLSTLICSACWFFIAVRRAKTSRIEFSNCWKRKLRDTREP